MLWEVSKHPVRTDAGRFQRGINKRRDLSRYGRDGEVGKVNRGGEFCVRRRNGQEETKIGRIDVATS